MKDIAVNFAQEENQRMARAIQMKLHGWKDILRDFVSDNSSMQVKLINQQFEVIDTPTVPFTPPSHS